MSELTVIAIDGPAASGKSTIGLALAKKLGYLFLDTGFMYRAVTLAALRAGVDLEDETAVSQLAARLTIDVTPGSEADDGRLYTAWLDGEDVTWELRKPEVDKNVSLVSSYLRVRQEMVRRQREFGQRGRVVMVGRDIGTVVMPDAPLKLYIVASPEERARRRWHDRQEQGYTNHLDTILADVIRRDAIDGSREHSPMHPADDAIVIDTTDRSVADILAEILADINAVTCDA